MLRRLPVGLVAFAVAITAVTAAAPFEPTRQLPSGADGAEIARSLDRSAGEPGSGARRLHLTGDVEEQLSVSDGTHSASATAKASGGSVSIDVEVSLDKGSDRKGSSRAASRSSARMR